MEEKVARVKEFLRMIKKFEEKRNVKCSSLLFETILLPQYINLESIRLSSMFKWLFLNWKQYSRPFPEVPDFETARKETATNKGTDTWEKEYVNKRHSPGEFSKAFSDVIKALPQKTTNNTKKHSQVALMEDMAAQGKVYDNTLGRWVKKEESDLESGYFVDPGEALDRIEAKKAR
ncbi:hypothetical protein KAR91_41185 [Candidatus Pacearchaeota archaeon]|nr:hypothetical protein [Candidatus Pacearchaeota archaeon]